MAPPYEEHFPGLFMDEDGPLDENDLVFTVASLE